MRKAWGEYDSLKHQHATGGTRQSVNQVGIEWQKKSWMPWEPYEFMTVKSDGKSSAAIATNHLSENLSGQDPNALPSKTG